MRLNGNIYLAISLMQLLLPLQNMLLHRLGATPHQLSLPPLGLILPFLYLLNYLQRKCQWASVSREVVACCIHVHDFFPRLHALAQKGV